MPLFLMLDEALGEHGVDQWLGGIETSENELAGAMPASELRSYIHDLRVEKGWKNLNATQVGVVYQKEPEDSGIPRADVYVGSTSNFDLISETGNTGWFEGDCPLAGSGAEFAYVTFPSSVLPKGSELEFRGEIQDRIIESWGDDGGVLFGGATGVENCYIDLLLLDGDRSLEAVERVLRDSGLPEGSGILFFDKTQQGRRRFL